jgi:hypothetical protein
MQLLPPRRPSRSTSGFRGIGLGATVLHLRWLVSFGFWSGVTKKRRFHFRRAPGLASSNMGDMKSGMMVRLILAGVLSTVARAQNKATEQKEPLFFIKIAADVASNVHSESLNGYLGFYVGPNNWSSGLSDSDTGPFMKLKEAKPQRSAVFFYSESRDAVVCVFLDGDVPFGIVTAWADSGGRIESGNLGAAYQIVSKEMLKKSERELSFSESEIAADDGQPFPAYRITGQEKPKKSPAKTPLLSTTHSPANPLEAAFAA